MVLWSTEYLACLMPNFNIKIILQALFLSTKLIECVVLLVVKLSVTWMDMYIYDITYPMMIFLFLLKIVLQSWEVVKVWISCNLRCKIWSAVKQWFLQNISSYYATSLGNIHLWTVIFSLIVFWEYFNLRKVQCGTRFALFILQVLFDISIFNDKHSLFECSKTNKDCFRFDWKF